MQQDTTTRYEVSAPTGTFYSDDRANALAWACRNGGPKARITMIAETRERVPSPAVTKNTIKSKLKAKSKRSAKGVKP